MSRFTSSAHVMAGLTLVASLWSVPSAAAAQTPARVLLRQLYGDLAFDVRTADANGVQLGVADATGSIAVTILARDLRGWADSVTKILAARPPRRGQTARWDAAVTGPGLVAGSMALSRSVAPGDTSIALLVTDTQFVGVRTNLTMAEARALAGAMRRAASAVLNPPRSRRPGTPRPWQERSRNR
ncbi:MAG TPA: hypothetical protein VF981_14610 [Gemmatimonadaceae bacterium]